MARSFNGSSSRIYATPALILAPPFTMACWFKVTNLTAGHTLMSLSRSSNSNHIHSLEAAGQLAGDPLNAQTAANGTTGSASSTIAYSANVWQHACGVWHHSSSRAAFLNGTNKGTNSVNLSPTSINEMNLGCLRWDTGHTAWTSGQIALPAIWNIALSDAEVASLAAGVRPDQVRPQNLISYQLFDPRSLDAVAGNLWTNSGSTDSNDHPPVR